MKKILIDSLKKYKWQIPLHIILVGLNIYILTIPATIIGNIIDLLYDVENNIQIILNNTYYLMGICVISLLLRTIWKYIETYISRYVEIEIRLKLFQRFLKLKLQNIQNIKNGEIMSYFIKDVNEIRSFVWRCMNQGIRMFFIFSIAIYKMAHGINLHLTIAVMIPIIFVSILIIKLKKYVEINFKRTQEKFTELSEYIQESTDSIRTTKAYACERNQLKEFIRKNRILRQSNNTVDIFSNLLFTSVQICFGICYGISLLYGSRLVVDGVITVGELVTFNGYIGLFVNPVNWLPRFIAGFQKSQIAYKRLDELFNLETEKINTKNNLPKEKLNGDILIQNLSFHYPEFLDTVLENINIKINKGETLGIIGTIGSGKTTLMNLITHLYSVPNEKIKIDGRDINEIPIEVLRSNICYITQDNFLFSTTLKENISLFKEEYDETDIEDSIKKAIVYEDIKNMPEGLETIIGERGIDLSGGQKQRVAISRAFLKNSQIIIFDDTFSALDNKTSEKLINNIKELSDEKTCIIISNKVSDVKYCDNIIVLEYGRIVGQGTHDELIANNKTYNSFYRQQVSKVEESLLE